MRTRWLISGLCLLGLAAVPSTASASSLLELYRQVPSPEMPMTAAGQGAGSVQSRLADFQRRLQLERAGLPAPAAVPGPGVDSAVLLAAIRGYEDYRAQHSADRDPAVLLQKRTQWLIQRFDLLRRQVGRQAVPDHDPIQEERKAWNALFRDWQAQRGPLVRQADQQITAIGDLQAIADPARRSAVQAYRLALLHEIDTQFSITRLSVERLGRAVKGDD